MRLIDDQMLRQIQDQIFENSIEGLQIQCTLEQFVCTLTNSERGEAEAINSAIAEQILQAPRSLSRPSSLHAQSQMVLAFPDIAMREKQNRKTYMFIVQALQQIFKNVDISMELQPRFVFEVPYSSSLAAVNSTLQSSLRDATHILPALKLALQELCPEDQTRVYTIDLAQARSNFIEGVDGVWSQNFLYYNVITKKIVIYILRAVPNENEDEFDYGGGMYGQAGVLDSDSNNSDNSDSQSHVIELDSRRQPINPKNQNQDEIYDID